MKVLLKKLKVELESRQHLFSGELFVKVFYNFYAVACSVNKSCLFAGSIRHPNCAPFSLHLSILLFNCLRLSDGLFNSFWNWTLETNRYQRRNEVISACRVCLFFKSYSFSVFPFSLCGFFIEQVFHGVINLV